MLSIGEKHVFKLLEYSRVVSDDIELSVMLEAAIAQISGSYDVLVVDEHELRVSKSVQLVTCIDYFNSVRFKHLTSSIVN